MTKRIWKTCHLFFSILIASLVLGSPAEAQQQQTSPTPAQSETQNTTPKKDQGDQENKQQGNQSGKSRLEKETGTVNDRIFEVMPNYGTVESGRTLPAISSKQKFQLATSGVFDYFTYPFIGALAAIGQAQNSPKSWGQGWGAYGKRYGASFADNGIGTYMTTALFPSILKDDPRYYEMREGSFGRRAFYSVDRLFVTRTDSGRKRFNYSEIIGNAVAAGVSNIYHAPEDRTVGRNMSTWGMLIMWDGVSNAMKEFWPDIRRKVFHKQSP
ncbi:MAG: hypothetical protein ACRD50_00375 [Candidatus Acidiferrales bacterium]